MNWVEQIELQKTQEYINKLPTQIPFIYFDNSYYEIDNTNEIQLLQNDNIPFQQDLTQIQNNNDTITNLSSIITNNDFIINNQSNTIQNDKNDILQMILDQNRLLEQKNQNINENQTTDNQKNYYMNQNLVYYRNVNSYLFLFYFLLIIIISYITIYSIRMNNYMKISTIIGFILFPFVIYDVEVWVFRILRYFYYFANGKVYTHIDL